MARPSQRLLRREKRRREERPILPLEGTRPLAACFARLRLLAPPVQMYA